jgi:glycosyltransferase involved in cell wall biosynthesis
MRLPCTTPTVSIIIPTHNRACLLREAVNSALNQSYPQVEVIVVDDGSTDETPAVAAQFGARIRYIRQKNAGVSVARNRGFAESHGAFVGFLDDDDVYFDDKIALQVEALQHHPDAPAANCNFYHMDPDGKLFSHNGILPSHDTFRHLVLSNYIWMSGPLIRREAMLTAGLFAPEFSLAADFDLWLRLSRLNDFVCVQKPLGAYRIHQGSMVTKAGLAEEDCMAVLQRAFQYLTESPADQKLRARSEAQWRLWFGTNYLNAGQPQEFTRNYRRAAECDIDLFRDQKFMANRIARDALSFRTSNTREFCNALFNHLPCELHFMRSYRDGIDQRIDFAQVLGKIAHRDVAQSRRMMKRAIEAHPHVRKAPAMLREMLFESTMCSHMSPEAHLARLRATLPEDEPFLHTILNEVTHDVTVWRGYLDYSEGRHQEARSRLVAGVVRRPIWLKNRGIAKTLMKSLLAR